jgi:nitrite reductase/ring-hydroxylating ferredoxin subunit
VSARGARRFIADLLRGRRPRSFHADEADAGELRAAIMLRAAQPGGAEPREEFVADLHRRLAAQLAPEHNDQPLPVLRPAVDTTRRRLVGATSLAAAAAAVGAVVDHTVISGSSGQGTAGGQQTLIPSTGQWHTVAASANLAEGGVQGFDLGTVIGFVARNGGQLRAVSGICTHLGCRLALDAPARRLDCPCHRTSFALNGELLHYQLPVPPAALPLLKVREVRGEVQVYAPGRVV